MEWFGLHAAVHPGVTFRNVTDHGKPFTVAFRKWIEDGILDNIFRILSLDAEFEELSMDASIVQAHQHSAGAKKGGLPLKSAGAEADQVPKSMPS